MFARIDTTIVGAAVAAGVLGASALISAGTAAAYNNDTAFLRQLAADGITPPSAQIAIRDAKDVCAAFENGHGATKIIPAVADRTGLSRNGAESFMIAAASEYCPHYVVF